MAIIGWQFMANQYPLCCLTLLQFNIYQIHSLNFFIAFQSFKFNIFNHILSQFPNLLDLSYINLTNFVIHRIFSSLFVLDQ